MPVSRGIVIDVPCTPEHSRVLSASRKTQRISITSISAFLSIIFPLDPPSCGDECSLGCGGIFPRDQQAGARVRKRRREGNEWAARVGRRYTIQRTIRWLKNRCQVGPTILFECPAQIPRSSLRSFSLWARHSAETRAELNVRSGAAEFFPVASRQVRG